VAKVKEMFDQSPLKSTRQAARESGLTRHAILKVLHKELNTETPFCAGAA